MATLSELRARVRRYLIDVPDDTNTEIDAWINEALRSIQHQHSFRFMSAEQSFTTTEDTRKLGDIPDRWKQARHIPWLHDGLGGTIMLDWAVTQHQMRVLYSQDDADDKGQPQFIRETETELEVYPFPDDNSLWDDGNYRVIVPYWEYLPELSNDGDSNVITTDPMGERYVLYQAVAEGMLFNREEERARIYFERAGQSAQRLINRDKKSHFTRDVTLAPRPGVYGARTGRYSRRHRRNW